MTDPRPLPLFEWVQSRHLRLAHHRRRRWQACLLALFTATLAASICAPPSARLVWNGSASAPIGLYRVWPGVMPMRGDLVLAWLPEDARDLAARRHYVPSTVPILKHAVGLPGDRLCSAGRAVTLNGVPLATRLERDRAGRILTGWQGCFRLGRNGYFLLNAPPDSFDGRYFGASDRHDMIGKAVLLWAR